MSFPQFFTLIFLLGTMPFLSYCRYYATTTEAKKYDINRVVVSRVITVDKYGKGDFTTVQQAVDAVPKDNQLWILIHVRAGVYNEKVTIERNKEFIVLEGESSRRTIISYEDGGDVIRSTTFKMFANNFVARNICFMNTYNRGLPIPTNYEDHKITWAPAALISGDKVSFYGCGFVSMQDTLSDFVGRHYFHNCYIEGAIDFIWGNGQSYFSECNINVTARMGGTAAYITAQGRETASQTSGFVFHSSKVLGTGPAFLGRAFRNHSRVLFLHTYMNSIVVPQGWSAWNFHNHEASITYAEVGCFGPGADKSKRVKWEKQLGLKELDNLVHVNKFINRDGWLERQP